VNLIWWIVSLKANGVFASEMSIENVPGVYLLGDCRGRLEYICRYAGGAEDLREQVCSILEAIPRRTVREWLIQASDVALAWAQIDDPDLRSQVLRALRIRCGVGDLSSLVTQADMPPGWRSRHSL